MCDMNNFIYCLSRLLHTYLSRYDNYHDNIYVFHHCAYDMLMLVTHVTLVVLNYNTA